MKNWVVKNDFGKYRYMAASINNEHLLDQCVMEAMIYDIQPMLGMALFYEIASQIDADTVTALNGKVLNGSTYTYNDETISFQGVKAALCYYSFARYTKRSGVHFTATGVVNKTSDFSEPISDKTRQRLSSDDTALADALKLEVIDYLNRTAASYPLWVCKTKKRTSTFRAIGL
jgi:hypothetical protein